MWGVGKMRKKPIAVKINNKEEYELAVGALDKAGFRWFLYPKEHHISAKERDEQEFYIFVDPSVCHHEFRGDVCVSIDRHICVGSTSGNSYVPDLCNVLNLTDFVDFFSSMTEKDVQEFLDLYSTEAEEEIDVPEDTEERHNTYLEIVTMPDRISITNISQEMRELIKVHWEIDATVNTETFGFVAEIDTADFLDFCKEFIIADLDKDDLLFITACSLALLQIEDKSMSSIRVLI